jgi:enoyl-CoA hydratase
MSCADPILVRADEGGIVLVTLNRPDTLNSADEQLHGAVAEVWGRAAAMPGARAIVLTGAGKAFSGGGDLGLLARMVDDPGLRTRIMAEAATIVRSMIACPLPVVAAVNGPAVGLGCSLTSLSDLVVMEEQAYLADPHVALGLVAGDGGALTWPLHMGLARSKEFLLLGSRIPARQALELGLANRVVAEGEAVAEATRLALRLASLPPQALRETRRVLNQPLVTRLDEALNDLLAAETASFDEDHFRASLKAMRERGRLQRAGRGRAVSGRRSRSRSRAARGRPVRPGRPGSRPASARAGPAGWPARA